MSDQSVTNDVVHFVHGPFFFFRHLGWDAGEQYAGMTSLMSEALFFFFF